jgi:hypothetical protein
MKKYSRIKWLKVIFIRFRKMFSLNIHQLLLWFDFFTCYSSLCFMSQKMTADFFIFLHIIYQKLSRNRTKNEFSLFNIRNFYIEKSFLIKQKKHQILNLSATDVTISSWVIINYKLLLIIKSIKEQKFNNNSIDN